MFDHALCTFCCVALYAVCRWRCVARLVSRDGLVRATERVGETKGRGKVRVESHAAVSVFAISLFSTPSPPFLSLLYHLLYHHLYHPLSLLLFFSLGYYSTPPRLLPSSRATGGKAIQFFRPVIARTYHHTTTLTSACFTTSAAPLLHLQVTPSRHISHLSPPILCRTITHQTPASRPPPPPKKGEEKHRRI